MIKRKVKSTLENEEGSGLVLALMVLLVLSVLGASLGVVTIGSLQLSTASRDTNSAYYIAEAGANMAYEDLKESVSKSYPGSKNYTDFYTSINSDMNEFFSEKNYAENTFTKQRGEHPTAKVHITKEDTGEARKYIIQSNGEVGKKERTVEKEIVITWKPPNVLEDPLKIPKEAAVIIKEEIKMNSANVEIIGDVYIEEKKSKVDPSKITGKIISGKNDFKKINFEQFEKYGEVLEKKAEKTKEKFDINSDKILKGDYKIDKLHIKNNDMIEIDIGNNNVLLFIEDFKQTGGVFEITGTGTFTLLVSESFAINGGLFNSGKKNVRIVLLDGGELSISGNPEVEVYAQIIAPESDVSISRDLYGIVIAESLKLHGNAKVKHYNFNFNNSGTPNSNVRIEELLTPGPTIESDE